METVLAIVTHADDAIIGAGGSIHRFAQEGKQVIIIAFSYGHSHLRKSIHVRNKEKESQEVHRILGTKNILYLDIPEKNIYLPQSAATLTKLIKTYKPSAIFTHGPDEIQPAHRAVHALVLLLLKQKKITCPVYCFTIWSLFPFTYRHQPKLVVDITRTISAKLTAALAYERRKLFIGLLLWKIIIEDWTFGQLNGYRFCELFSKIN